LDDALTDESESNFWALSAFLHIELKAVRPATHRYNGIVRIRHQCSKTTVLSCHRRLINSGLEKINI
jgi:hypothetical protein